MLIRRFQVIAICAFALSLLAGPCALAKEKDTMPGRLLTGKVLDKQDNAVTNAVVYVTDTRTRAVKTYIVGPDGIYRFPALATNVDYEIYAQSNGKNSDTKRMSQFDDRKVVDIVLRIDAR
jgi:Carboxypeptidase regulatory-like domain